MSHGRAARQTVRRHLSGVLSTHSAKHPGFPYGSAVPHMCDALGRPVILISHLAEHTHNIEADDRVSFLVAETGADLQTHGRASVLGRARVIPSEEVQARYLRYHPEGERSLAIGGFRFFRIEPLQVRFIAGFGGIHWVPGDSYLAPATALMDAEEDILQHMNADHRDTMVLYCQHLHQYTLQSAIMTGIDPDGFDIRADERVLRFEFPGVVTTAGEARKALITLAELCRGQ
ncbi:MAG: HugZ family protein [Burkholderiales bacterium]